MDSYNLKTACGYINNLLLARGLLRDGKPIEFAHPSKGEGGKEATMARIINVVHDLILKRDRDQDQRENLIQTIRTMRSESTQTTQKLERLQTKNEDLARQLSLGQSQERSAKLALRTAESSARALREEMARLKTTVQQVRTSCANDIRKRDVQIQRLKSHLTAQQRGNKSGLVGASITITPGVTGMGSATGGKDYNHPTVDDPDYSLKQETTEFLTQLSQSLSDENDNLIGLVRSTLSTLRHLQGLPDGAQMMGDNAAVGDDEQTENNMLQALPTSYDALASDMDAVLENLRNLLTNPNFVSIEEVEVREQQILRLRMGWEKMELRWREAVLLMDGWRKRLLKGGETVNLDELKMGLGLGVGLETVNGGHDVSVIDEEDEDEDGILDEDELEQMEQELDEQESSFEMEEAPAVRQSEKTNNTDLFNIKLPQLQQEAPPLRETDGNATSPRKVNFAPSVQSSPRASPITEQDENTSQIDLVRNDDTKTTQLSPIRQRLERSRGTLHESRIPRQTATIPPTRKRTPSPHLEERSPKLTVHDKLHQAEAEAARIADGLTASGRTTTAKPVNKRNGDESKDGSKDDKLERARSRIAARKTKIGGRPRKRKSTLTPEELEGLMFAS